MPQPPYYSRTAENELAYKLSETAEYADPERTRDWLHTWLPDHERAEDPTRALLSALASARGIERAADELLRELVTAARAMEMSWTAVGNATAMTRQSAQQRWAPHTAEDE